MVSLKVFFVAVVAFGCVSASPSAVDLLGDIYNGCIKQFSIGCVKPKAMSWMSKVLEEPVIKVTDDLVLVKKSNPLEVSVSRFREICSVKCY